MEGRAVKVLGLCLDWDPPNDVGTGSIRRSQLKAAVRIYDTAAGQGHLLSDLIPTGKRGRDQRGKDPLRIAAHGAKALWPGRVTIH